MGIDGSLTWGGDAPQDWPPGPVVPYVDTYYGIDQPDGAGLDVVPTPIGDQSTGVPVASDGPPLTPNGTASGTPQGPPLFGTGAVIVPPTWGPPVS